MRVLVTGHNGYLGAVMVGVLQAGGHEVVGLDTYLFGACTFGQPTPDVPALRLDVRDVQASDLAGFDAVVHLAALSNDPLGDLDPELTYAINHRASVRLARLAREAGVARFLFSSSCSLYGAAGTDELLAETADFNPVTAYGTSKVLVEQDVSQLATDDFSPTFLRNATAYGVSPRLRCDLVVNNLVAYALTSGVIVLKSDGTPWRPLVHAEDIARAFLAVLNAPRDLVHNQAFNVGQSSENYRISELAELTQAVVPGCRVEYAEGAGPDPRCYRVSCDKLATTLPEFEPAWTVQRGIEQLYAAYRQCGMTTGDFHGRRYQRIEHVKGLLAAGELDPSLRWRAAALAEAH
jgi:nucleoside-diphosphate-sugar epimerase